MLEYVEKKRSIADSLAENLHPISNEDLIEHILTGLDSSYGPFITAYMIHDNQDSIDDLVGMLLQEESRLEQELLRHATSQVNSQSSTPPTPNSTTALALNTHRSSPRSHQSSNVTTSGSRQFDTRRRPRPQCQLCDKPGHEARDCWQRNNQKDYPSRKPNPRSNNPQANLAHYNSPSTVYDLSWYVGSGATDHVTPDVQKLHITKNLLSVLKLTNDNQVYMEFWPSHCNVKSLQGKLILQGDVSRSLYRLPSFSNKGRCRTMALTGMRTTLHGWHQRLAHPHAPLLRHLLCLYQLPTSSNNFPDVCEPCQFGKSHRLSFTHTHVSSSKPFDLVYSDVCGPSPYFSMNGNRYFLLFVDDCTKFVWIYFLSHKSQVFDAFVQFRTMIHTQFNCLIRSLQTDWGGEYRNVSNFLKTHGILHRVSCPHTHEQNGAVERRNRIIVEKGLTLMAQASIPNQFWEHAFQTATFLHNRTITPVLSYLSPYQKLYSQIPDYTSLKTFGCLCYPFLRPYNRHKVDFRSLPCVFVGYSPTHKGYMCYHVPSERIYIARHVVFNESVFPYSSPDLKPSPDPILPSTQSDFAPTLLARLNEPPPPTGPTTSDPSTPPCGPTPAPHTSPSTPNFQRSTVSSRAHQSPHSLSLPSHSYQSSPYGHSCSNQFL